MTKRSTVRTVCIGALLAVAWAVSGSRAEGQSSIIETDTKATLTCDGCHAAGKPLPYLGGEQFHRGAHSEFDSSHHAAPGPDGKPRAACLDCHSTNGQWDTVFPASDPRSTINRVRIAETCSKCHETQAGTFLHSIHGLAEERGINAAATCSDCHGSHAVFASSDPRSSLSKTNTPATCAKCHESIRADFETSTHHEAFLRGEDRAPVCTTCHTAVSHSPAPASLRAFDMQTVETCAKCHEKQAPSYRDTFHGQATALGFKPAATCADCHTPHQNLPAADARSSVNPANLIGTCGRCHAGATASFVTYDPHAQPANMDRSFPIFFAHTFMKWLFLFVFGFFGIHTLLWLQRALVGLMRGDIRRIRGGRHWVHRFNKPARITHIIMASSFMILAATGLPLMYYYTGWGQILGRSLGGLEITRVLHRIFAIVTFGYAIYHLAYIIWHWLIRRVRHLLSPESMIPNRKDFEDFWHMMRWFVYLEKRPPHFDRWTYWEKFDYFAVFWGVPIIGLSGLVLWMPGFFSSFLPGWVLNVAMIIHGEEALLATGFIFAFHFFHNLARPESFPIDSVIFTGKMPLKRFQEERPEEYKRIVEEGRLDEILTEPPSVLARAIAETFGLAAFVIGTALTVAIFWSLLTH